jgi:hypothetical protein
VKQTRSFSFLFTISKRSVKVCARRHHDDEQSGFQRKSSRLTAKRTKPVSKIRLFFDKDSRVCDDDWVHDSCCCRIGCNCCDDVRNQVCHPRSKKLQKKEFSYKCPKVEHKSLKRKRLQKNLQAVGRFHCLSWQQQEKTNTQSFFFRETK